MFLWYLGDMSGSDKEQWRKIKQGKGRVILGKRHYFGGVRDGFSDISTLQ